MPKFFSICLASLFLCQALLADECPRIENRKKIDKFRTQEKEIIFFASWCKSCVTEIKTADPKKSVLVGVMDSKENIEKAFSFLKVEIPCFYGGEKIASAFAVKYLPFSL